jgi:hypothetical protein
MSYMTTISIMIEGQDGLTWPRWKRLAAEVERLGYAGLFRSDHFTNSEPPDKESLELVISLAYLASSTSRIHFGSLVASFSFRDPAMLARQAAAATAPSARCRWWRATPMYGTAFSSAQRSFAPARPRWMRCC